MCTHCTVKLQDFITISLHVLKLCTFHTACSFSTRQQFYAFLLEHVYSLYTFSEATGGYPLQPCCVQDYHAGIAMDTFEMEVSLPHTPAASWALNDSLRVLGMFFPPCSDSRSSSNLPPPPDTLLDPFQQPPGIHHMPEDGRHPARFASADHGEGAALSPGSHSYPNSCSPAGTGDGHGHMHGLHGYGAHAQNEEDEDNCACWGPCMPVMQWFSHALDVPDYVTYCSCPAHLRQPAHGVGLLLMLVPMALMRVTIPTVSGDFYDAFIFIVASTLAPFAAAPLFGMGVPLWLQVVFAVVSCASALSFVASGVRHPLLPLHSISHFYLCSHCDGSCIVALKRIPHDLYAIGMVLGHNEVGATICKAAFTHPIVRVFPLEAKPHFCCDKVRWLSSSLSRLAWESEFVPVTTVSKDGT